MFKFGRKSLANLDTCHPAMKEIAARALQLSPYDFAIVHGWRGEEIQNALYASGASSKQWPDSLHNYVDDKDSPCSLAIDFAPVIGGSIPWEETHIFAAVAGCFFAAAKEHGTTLRWGGDWDGDGNTKEHKLQDWGHLELTLEWS